MMVHTGEPKSRRVERRSGLVIGTEGFAVKIELRIKLAWSPAGENLFHHGLVHSQHLRERAKVRCRGNDRAHVQGVALGQPSRRWPIQDMKA
jgi:hypothetical protein